MPHPLSLSCLRRRPVERREGAHQCGLAIVDTARDEDGGRRVAASVVNLYTDDAILVLRRSGNRWTPALSPPDGAAADGAAGGTPPAESPSGAPG